MKVFFFWPPMFSPPPESIYPETLSKLLEERSYPPKTAKLYTTWIRKFQTCTHSQDPNTLTPDDARAFLASLVGKSRMTVSRQNQVYDVLLLLYQHVLKQKFDVERPRPKPQKKNRAGAGSSKTSSGQGTSWEAEYTHLEADNKRRQYSPRTLKTSRMWGWRFQACTNSHAPRTLTVEVVKAYLSYLAVVFPGKTLDIHSKNRGIPPLSPA